MAERDPNQLAPEGGDDAQLHAVGIEATPDTVDAVSGRRRDGEARASGSDRQAERGDEPVADVDSGSVRDANQLAADVRAYIEDDGYGEQGPTLAALDELVALVGTLQQDARDIAAAYSEASTRAEALQQERDEQPKPGGIRGGTWEMGTPGAERLVYWHRRAVAAEAALAEARCRLHPPGEWCDHCRSRAGA